MIDLIPDTEQQALIDSIRDFLAHELPVERLRPKRGSAEIPAQADLWRRIADQGWFGIAVPEAQGGIGLTLVEEALACREFGRYLLSPAVPAAGSAARLALVCGQPSLCGEIVSGRARIGIAYAGETSAGDCHLVDAASADFLLRVGERDTAIYSADCFSRRERVDGLDTALPLERAHLAGTPVAIAHDAAVGHAARLQISAMLAGIAEATRDMAVAYAGMREQFGRPIGSFQAIKHKCADMAVRAESSWCQTAVAAMALQDAMPDAEFHAAAAAIVAIRAALDNSEQNIQVHGGIGFTVELDAHLYLKRSHLLHRLSGGVRANQHRLLDGIQ